MDKLSALTAFLHVVEQGSFAAAARELGASRSQINRHVINLEDDLGVQLLNRTTRSVSVTPIGDSYYKRTKAILEDLKEAEHAMRSEHHEPQGEVRINAPMSFGVSLLGKALIDFMQAYPKIKIQLVLSDQFIDAIADGFDITIRIAGRKENASLIEHELGEVRRILCASPDFLGVHPDITSPKQLSELPCLHYGNLPTGNLWRLESTEDTKDIKVKGMFCSNNADVLCELAVTGLGVALLPIFIAESALATKKLVRILEPYTAPKVYLSLLYAPNRHLSTRIHLLVTFLQKWFEKNDL